MKQLRKNLIKQYEDIVDMINIAISKIKESDFYQKECIKGKMNDIEGAIKNLKILSNIHKSLLSSYIVANEIENNDVDTINVDDKRIIEQFIKKNINNSK